MDLEGTQVKGSNRVGRVAGAAGSLGSRGAKSL